MQEGGPRKCVPRGHHAARRLDIQKLVNNVSFLVCSIVNCAASLAISMFLLAISSPALFPNSRVMLRSLVWNSTALSAIERNTQVAIRNTFPSPITQLTGNVEVLGAELDCLVVLTKPNECTAQVAIRNAFPNSVPQLTGNVKVLGVELDRFVVLTKAVKSIAQVAMRSAFPSPVTQLTENVETPGVELN